ncbi:MAG: AAA family ATPase [Acidobacteriota bacterium]|nr:AAA family ATPase [Acidobacteriota bacterium]
MRLLSLTVFNLGVFRGRHHFEFTPVHKPEGKPRHLVVISGHNGVGKSTLFQSLDLALHGSLSLGDRISRADYNRHLMSRLHRFAGTGMPVTSRDGGVELSFEYVQSGKPLHVEVKRDWHRSGSNVTETLAVLCNGKPPDVDATDYQSWLNELVPHGLAPLCFFDAEHLDLMASAESHRGLMGESLRRLLGLDLVERLQSDLERYTSVQGGGRKVVERLRAEALQHQAAIEEHEEQLRGLRAQSEALAAEAQKIEAALTAQENRLTAEGGNYAARRPALQERLSKLEGEIKKVTAQIETLSSELLPFCLVPELCQQLGRRLLHEARLHLRRTTEGLWHERVDKFQEALKSGKVWKGLELSDRSRAMLVKRMVRELKANVETDVGKEDRFIHYGFNTPSACCGFTIGE